MHPLYQRLKELDSDTFESLCFELLHERHPGLPIRRVRGSGGDKGVDIFLGSLKARPHIWQCKSFPDGIRDAQKRQILNSLKQALKHYSPRRWTLCLPIDLTIKTMEWFDEAQRQFAERVDIDLWSASNMVTELDQRRTLREAYFPGAVMESVALRERIAGTAVLNDDDLGKLTADNADLYLERLKSQDPRFHYQMTLLSEHGGVEVESKGRVFTIKHGRFVVDAFTRDVEALRADPPTITVGFKETGTTKFEEFRRKGHTATLRPEDFFTLATSLKVIPKELLDPSKAELTLKSSSTAPIPCRLTFGKGANAVVYEYVDLMLVRAGSEEVELCTREGYPFSIRATIGSGARGSLNFQLRFKGFSPSDGVKFISALLAAMQSHRVECFDLKKQHNLFAGSMAGAIPEWLVDDLRVLEDAAFAENQYGARLNMPEEITEQDATNLTELRALATGDVGGPGSIDLTIIKKQERNSEFTEHIDHLLWVGPSAAVPVFGIQVPVGLIKVELADLTLDGPAEFDSRFTEAKIGETIEARYQFRSSLRSKVIV